MNLSALAAAALLLSASTAFAQTGFTYQGRLDSGAAAANGSYDLRFRLLNIDGTQAGVSCSDNVQVVNGLFTTLVDFGAVFSTPAPLNMEIAARPDTGLACGSGAGYTVMSPQQTIRPTPQAVHARTAAGLTASDGFPAQAVTVDSVGNVGIGVGAAAPLGVLDVRSGTGAFVRIDSVNGDLHVNGGNDGYFGLYNDGAAGGQTEFLSFRGVNMSISNQTGNIGMGLAPTVADKLTVLGNIRATGVIITGAATQYKSIHGSAFVPEFQSSGSNQMSILTDAGIQASNGGSFCTNNVYYAPVELPHGATITNLLVTYYDNGPCGIWAELQRVNLFNATPQNVATLPYEDFNGTTIKVMSTATFTAPVVDNSTYVYFLRMQINGANVASGAYMRVLGARITYTVTSPYP
jgi:hypothetical protein